MSRVAPILFVSCLALAGCGASSQSLPADSQVGAEDTGEVDSAIDSGDTNTVSFDSEVDTAPEDTGTEDSSASDSAAADTANADTASTDTAAPDTAVSDTGPADTSPADPCTPLPSGLTTWTKTDTASVGTPDTYFFDVNPGDPFCATITGGGSGTWSVNVSNGTSSGLYCSGSSKCSILVPAGQMTLLATAVTTDIGGYTLTVRYRPR